MLGTERARRSGARRLAAAVRVVAAACVVAVACDRATERPSSPGGAMAPATRPIRIGFLHHSTGKAVWSGGVPEFISAWNEAHGTDYRITPVAYPATTGGWPWALRRLARATYPWANFPYDYWNLWVNHTGRRRDRGELNLDDLAARYDVIVFKHCFPVSHVKAADGAPSVSSPEKTLENYRLQYDALKARLRQFPRTRFVVWTGAALPQAATTPEEAARARSFAEWVKGAWDEKGDNVFVWDFHALETGGGPYLKEEHATSPEDAHPNPAFARKVAPLLGRRLVDVIEGRGDEGSLTGAEPEGTPRAPARAAD